MGGASGAALGLIVGVLALLFGGLVANIAGREAAALVGFGVLGLIFFPLTYGVIGLIGGAIYAFLYNILAGVVGGIKLELE